MGEKTTPTGHTQALISLKEIEEVNCPLCGALVNVDVRQGPARNRRVQDFPETLKRATIFGGDGAAMHRCGAEDRQREALRLAASLSIPRQEPVASPTTPPTSPAPQRGRADRALPSRASPQEGRHSSWISTYITLPASINT